MPNLDVAAMQQERRRQATHCTAQIGFSIISSHNIGNLRDVEGGRILDEYRVADEILTQHEQIIRANNPKARKVLLEGNHDFRIERYIDAHPATEGMLEVPTVLNLAKRKNPNARAVKREAEEEWRA